MTLRWVPPAHSPVSASGLLRGALGATGVAGDASGVTETITRTFGDARVTLTDSGTSALTLALRTAVLSGVPVAFPSYCCIDIIAAAQGANIRVRLYDVDPATLSPDLDSLRRTVARGVGAILVTPLFGYPYDVSAVQRIAAEAGVPLIEDAAQSAGATFNGRRIGSFGALTVLSFSRGKGTTGGSGGALLVRDPAYFENAEDVTRRMVGSGAGWSDVIKLSAQWVMGRPSVYWIPSSIPALHLGEMIYHPPHEPHAISRAACAMVGTALSLDAAEVASRRDRARALLSELGAASPVAPVTAVAGGDAGHLRLAVVARDESVGTAPQLGILRGYPITLDQHEASRAVLADGESAGSGAGVLRDRLLTVPVHSRMSAGDLRRVAAWLSGQRPSRS